MTPNTSLAIGDIRTGEKGIPHFGQVRDYFFASWHGLEIDVYNNVIIRDSLFMIRGIQGCQTDLQYFLTARETRQLAPFSFPRN